MRSLKTITIYGADNCPNCEEAKDHLDKLGYKYVYQDAAILEDVDKNPDWDTNGSTACIALLEFNKRELPIIQIDDGAYDLTSAINFLDSEYDN